MKRCLVQPALAVCLLLAAMPATAADARWALLVGNDNYPKDDALQTCINDARHISAWLQSVGYQPDEVQLLLDADRAQIVAGLQAVADKCHRQRARQVVIYFSGHGIFLDDDDGDEGPEDRLDEGFVGVFNMPVETASDLDKIVLRDDQFYPYIQDLRQHCDQVVLILDACFSGGATKGLLGPTNIKSLRVADLVRQVPAGDDPGKGLDPGAPTSRDITRDRETAELARPGSDTSEGQLLILAASNQYQPAQAGSPPHRPLSRFTEALLDTVASGDAPASLDFDQLRERLTRTLQTIPQTPEVVPVGLASGATFVPGVFPRLAAPLPDERVARLLHLLLTLPEAGRQAGWTIQAKPTQPEPLAVGTRFALDVTTNQAGYLVVVTVEQSGRVAIQYPNCHRPLSQIKANTPTVIPYPDAFRVKPPVGQEKFFVFLLDQDLFRGFNFGQYQGSLVVGQLKDVPLWFPELDKALKIIRPEQAIAHGVTIEPNPAQPNAAPPNAPAPNQPAGPPPLKWAREVIMVQTVNPLPAGADQ